MYELVNFECRIWIPYIETGTWKFFDDDDDINKKPIPYIFFVGLEEAVNMPNLLNELNRQTGPAPDAHSILHQQWRVTTTQICGQCESIFDTRSSFISIVLLCFCLHMTISFFFLSHHVYTIPIR